MCVRGVCPCVCARVCHWLCSTTSRHARCVISLKPTNKPSPLRRILTVCRWLPFNGTLRLASSLPRLPPSCARVRVRVCFNTTKRRRLALPCDPMRGYRCFLHPLPPFPPHLLDIVPPSSWHLLWRTFPSLGPTYRTLSLASASVPWSPPPPSLCGTLSCPTSPRQALCESYKERGARGARVNPQRKTSLAVGTGSVAWNDC